MAAAGAATLFVAVTSAALSAQEPKIINRPLAPEEIATYALPEGTQTSTGLTTVGVGSAVYLEAQSPQDVAVSGISWELTAKPSGSAAALLASPLGPEVPSYMPSDIRANTIIGRQLLIPDVKGQYTITATVQADTGAAVTFTPSITITAATYVGVGTIGGTEPTFPQCAMCHPEQAEAWAATGHASMLQRGLDGTLSDHYGAGCIGCHTVGYDAAPAAANGGFDDVAAATGWEFPMVTDEEGNEHADLHPGTFDALPPELKALANIQCESCHGPGSEHAGNPEKIGMSLGVGACAVCHDSGTHHYFPREWSNSLHAAPVDESGRGSCAVCHTGDGFVDRVEKGLDITQVDYADQVERMSLSSITCASCHDPHDVSNEHQLRTVADVELLSGDVITEGGNGKLCMNCHKSRRVAVEYVTEYHGHYGPHHSPQADMLAGANAIEYGRQIRSSAHIYATEDACATCHMQSVAADDPNWLHLGSHTFSMEGEDGSQKTEVCTNCHGPMQSYNLAREDFDGDGTVEGVQTEVGSLVHLLGTQLPPMGEADVVVTEEYTPQQLAAAYDYFFVEDDGSMGIHNTRYAVGILKAAIKDLTGHDIVTAVAAEASGAVPAAFALEQNAPNPFNPSTVISYAVPTASDVELEIRNSVGQVVRRLVSAYHTAGSYRVTWDGRDGDGRQVTAGVYFYTLTAGDHQQTMKMAFLP